MTTLATPILDEYCPVCTRLKRDHPDLLDDIVVTPTFLVSTPQEGRRYRNGTVRVIGCQCVRRAFGPWPTMADAKRAVALVLADLRAAKERTREAINQALNAQKQQSHPNVRGVNETDPRLAGCGIDSARQQPQLALDPVAGSPAPDGQQCGTPAESLGTGAPAEGGESLISQETECHMIGREREQAVAGVSEGEVPNPAPTKKQGSAASPEREIGTPNSGKILESVELSGGLSVGVEVQDSRGQTPLPRLMRRHEEVAGCGFDSRPLNSADDAPMSGLCEGGSSLWASHDWDYLRAICKRCNAPLPR